MSSGFDLFTSIANSDQVKDVLPQAAEGLKKLRDLEQAVSSAGQGAADAMQSMMKQAGQALGGLQQVAGMIQQAIGSSSSATPTIPTGSYAASHEQAADATNNGLTQLVDELNTLTTLEAAVSTMLQISGPISAYLDHEEFIRRMDIYSNIYIELASRDLSILGSKEINGLFNAMSIVLTIFDSLDEYFFVHFQISDIVNAHVDIIQSLDFTGLDKGEFNGSATALLDLMFNAPATRYGTHCLSQFAHAAAILVDYLNKEWTLDPTAACVKTAVDQFYPELHGMIIDKTMTYATLTALIQKLIDAIDKCAVTKAIGAPMGSSSSIPQIGSMIDSTLSDYIKKAITDEKKVQDAVEKFTKQQTIVQKKKEIIQGMHKKGSGDGGGADAKPAETSFAQGSDPAAASATPSTTTLSINSATTGQTLQTFTLGK
jgi:hypothetical protein